MTEQVRWTPEGKAARAAAATLRDASEATLAKRVFATAKKQAARWKRGLAKADAEGQAAVAYATKTIVAGKLPRRPSVDDAARLLSLVGASGSESLVPLAELVVRQERPAFVIEVLAKMWSHRTRHDNPDWPDSEKRAAAYVTTIDDDDDHVHDASTSYAKAVVTRYLHARFPTGAANERRQFRAGVTAIWKTTTPHARPALAYATRDPKRAKQSAEELIAAGESPWPYFAWAHLPDVLDDAALALRIGDGVVSPAMIANLGTAIWDAYAERVTGRMDSHARARILREFANYYGPRTALVLAEYEGTRACDVVVRDYFTRYPELLDKIIDEPSLAYHREDLEKLRAGRPARGRRRS